MSPPNCLASIKEVGAVGRTANKTKIEIIILSSSKYFAKTKINIGIIKCFAILEIISSLFEDFISFITSPNPTDKSPIGSAALLNISKVLFIITGK